MGGEINWEFKNPAPLWGGEVAKEVSFLNQGGMLWTFKLPRQLAAAN